MGIKNIFIKSILCITLKSKHIFYMCVFWAAVKKRKKNWIDHDLNFQGDKFIFLRKWRQQYMQWPKFIHQIECS